MLPQAKALTIKSPKSLSEKGGLEGRSPSKISFLGVVQVAKPPARHPKTSMRWLGSRSQKLFRQLLTKNVGQCPRSTIVLYY